MVSRPSSLSLPVAALRVTQERRASWVLALGLPILFLHRDYQPATTLHLGGTSVTVALSDLVLVAIVLTAVVAGRRERFAPLRRGLWLWVTAIVLLALVGLSLLYGNAHDASYPFGKHLVTALKEVEYFLIAPAAVLLVRSRRDLEIVLAGLFAWSCAMAVAAVLQFLGIVDQLQGHQPNGREPAYVGLQDYSALAAATLSFALLLIALGSSGRSSRRLAWTLGIVGGLGVAIAGSLAGVIGLALAAVAAALVVRRRGGISRQRLAGLAAVVVVVGAGATLLRSASIADFLRFIGLEKQNKELTNVSYPQRTLLGYIGLRMFADHPLVGVGWQGSAEEANYRPYLADARKRFSSVQAKFFPSPQHPWGVQNDYLQVAADMGLVGLAALVALALAALRLGWLAALRAPPELAAVAALPLLWLLVVAGVWNAIGIVAGLPLDALTWLAAGLAVAALGMVTRADA